MRNVLQYVRLDALLMPLAPLGLHKEEGRIITLPDLCGYSISSRFQFLSRALKEIV